jgi:TRAP-type mannitol/chloroaromatic compound transport system permease large subunit
MLQWGYSKRLAAGTICAAGTLGQIIPPSLVLVLLTDTISSAYQKAQLANGVFSPETVSVSDLFAGAIIPGLLLVAAYLLFLFVITIVRPEAVPAPPQMSSVESISTLVLASRLVPPLALIVGVLGSILSGVATPTESASIGAVGAIVLAGFGTQERQKANLSFLLFFIAILLKMTILPALGIHGTMARIIVLVPILPFVALVIMALLRLRRSDDLFKSCEITAHLSAMVFMILIGAAMLSLVFRGFGGDEAIQSLIASVHGGPMVALAGVMLVMFLLGFILDFIEIIFVIVPTVAPALLMAGVDPIWLAILISLNLQTSFLTPPFGFALFYFRSSAPPQITTRDIYIGVIPFIIIQIAVLGLVAAVPDLATWLPYALR